MDFLSLVKARETLPDETIIDHPALARRMQHPFCVECHEQYKTKFPDQPFQIICDGVYDDVDYQAILADPENADMKYAEVRELYDKAYWGNRHITLTDGNGDKTPFKARDYQEKILRCTAYFKVDRCGRGTGKTTVSEVDDLHTVTTRNNYPLLVATPGKALAQKIFDEIKSHIESDPELKKACIHKKQAPFFQFTFSNGSTYSIFTTGSEAGRDSSSIRGVSPWKVRLDEQDLLNAGDYTTLRPLWRRYPWSQFHGSSTPTGKREDFYEMCKSFPSYKEFYFPITVHPDWNVEKEKLCRLEARTEINFLHEFMAEFGDQVGGVFRNEYVDLAKVNYKYSDCAYDSSRKYFMGIDWNGGGTGARMRVVEFNPVTKMRRCVAHAAVDDATREVYQKLVDLNRTWHCEEVYIDHGHGHIQAEQIQNIGFNSTDPDDKRLRNIKIIDFGANLSTNKITPNRNYAVSMEEMELERRAKPFLVEGAVMCLEERLFQFSFDDKLIEDQLRAYHVKNYSPHGWANTYGSGNVGDHDLDALMLALLGIELKYGIYYGTGYRGHLPAMASIAGIGTGTPGDASSVESGRQAIRATSGVPSRTPSTKPAGAEFKQINMQNNSHWAIPAKTSSVPSRAGGVPSRTSSFRSPGGRSGGRLPYGGGGGRFR